jgi:hypothetical protein
VLAVTLALLIFHRSSPVDSPFAAISAAFLMHGYGERSAAANQHGLDGVRNPDSHASGQCATRQPRGRSNAAHFLGRRRLLRPGVSSGAPAHTFTEVLLATALPVHPKVQFLTAGTGFLIALPFRFWFWPAREVHALSDAAHFFSARKTLLLDALLTQEPGPAAISKLSARPCASAKTCSRNIRNWTARGSHADGCANNMRYCNPYA